MELAIHCKTMYVSRQKAVGGRWMVEFECACNEFGHAVLVFDDDLETGLRRIYRAMLGRQHGPRYEPNF